MKILDINNMYSPTGGGIRIYHHEKLRWCRNNGIENLLIYPSTENTETCNHGGIIRGLKSPRLGGSGYNFFTKGEPLRQEVVNFKPDIVELGSDMVVPGMVKSVLTNIPSFVYFHSNWPEALPLSVLGITGGIFPRLFRMATMPLMTRAYSYLDAVIAGSDFSLNVLREAGLTKLRKVPLGTDPDTFHPGMRSEDLRRALGVPAGGRLLLFMGRLAPEKGIHVLLDACSRLFRQRGLVVAVAGGGHWQKKVKRTEAKYPDKMKFLNRINSRKEAAQLMASADAFISAGPCETFSLATLEALCCGTPVVACREAAAAELVTNAGGNSVYSPWNSSIALADAILVALETGESDRRDFRAFAEKYTWDACFSKLLDVYKCLIP
jgi:glycosyltransferase involved in cell wall biosynthesis